VGNFSVSGNFVVSGNSLLFQTTAPDAYTWDGGAGNGSWNAAANWVGDQAPPDWKTIHFAGNNQLDVNIDTDQSVLGIVFDANAESFTINSTSNNTINLAGNIESDSPYDQTINCHINLVTNTVIAADAGRLAFGGLLTFGENSKFLAISGANSTDITGNISGNGSLLKRGAGTLTLSGANTYDGETLINAGNLILQGGAALKDSGIVKLAASGAILTIGASETIGSLQGGGTTAIHSGQTLTIAQTGSATYAGAITGAGALTKTGSGTLTLSGSNNHTGGTTLSGGTLQLLHANALGNGELHLSSGTLAVGNASNSVGLFVPGHITWASSNAIVSLASTGNITTAGNFTHGGNVGNRTFDFGSGQYLQLGNNTLVNFGATTFNATHFQTTYSPGTSLAGHFQIVGNSLVYVLQGGSASGSVINNSGAGGTPTWMDFTVNGSATTATGNNTIRSLTFANNGNLAIQAGHSLMLTQGQVAVENGTSLVSSGTLATPGNFNKTGTGELDVQSTLAVNGTASIDAGLLSVNGQLIADSVVVNPNATLGGAGLIVGNVNVNGNLSPGNSPGTLAIAGNLALTGANSTLIEIASPTNFDRIVVSGRANLGGVLNVVEFGDFEIAYGQQYAFLTAGGGISGEFDAINTPATFRGRFLNLGTTGVLLIAPDTYTRVAVTPNQREVAQALDSFIPATSGDRETVSIALDLQTAEQYPYSFEQIMPGFYESLANIAIEQTYNQAQLLTQRLGTVRLGATGFQAIGLSQPIKYDKDGKSASDAKTASPIVESAIDTNWNSWVIANGEFSLSRGLSGVPNYKNNAGGFLVGADYRLSENFATGLFAGYEYSYAKYNGGSSTAGNSALFGLYGSYTHEDGYYADAIVSGGYTGFQTRRSIEFSTIDRTASANPNSGQFSAALNLGKDFEIGKFTLGPIIGAQYTYAGIGGFTETGAESLDLALGWQNANSLRTNLGARLAYNWEVGSNITLIPEVRGFWMHEFLNNPRNISSSLDGGNGASFDYETSAPYRNSVFGGVGISAKFADRWSASVFYNVNFGAEGYTNNIISTSLVFSF
jgi:outer membrane autotransporter protein